MKVSVDVPENIARIFAQYPNVKILELIKDHGLSDYKARIYHWLHKNGEYDHGVPFDPVSIETEVACRHAIMAGLKKKNLPTPFRNMLARLVNGVEDALERPMTIPLETSSGKESACLCLSDWHSGKQVYDDYRQCLYNKDILSFRIALMKQRLLKLLTQHIRKGTVDELNILLLGDLVDGSGIYPGQLLNQDMSSYSDQVVVVVAGIWDLVMSIRREIGIPIKIWAVRGNHGRQSKEAPAENNFDLMVYQMLYMMAYYEDPENVTVFYATTTPYLNVKVKGWRLHLRHEAPPQTETAAARAKLGGWQNIHKWDVLCHAHLHHPGNSTYMESDTVMNGAPIGIDDYSEGMAKCSRPSQTLFGIDPDLGFSFKYNIYLDQFGKGGEAEAMMERYPMLRTV